MKKTIALALSIVLILVSLACTSQAEENPRFVTIQEWLEAEGKCGDCMLLLKITQILNPVLAIAADDTGNGEDSTIINFMSDECPPEGAILVIANPRFNEFEGSVEMADWTVLRIMRDPTISVEE
jgi:hypothetical protein